MGSRKTCNNPGRKQEMNVKYIKMYYHQTIYSEKFTLTKKKCGNRMM
jgi:hypothetical protein